MADSPQKKLFSRDLIGSPRHHRFTIQPSLSADPIRWVDEWPLSRLVPVAITELKCDLLAAYSAVFERHANTAEEQQAHFGRLTFDAIAVRFFDAGELSEELMKGPIQMMVSDAMISAEMFIFGAPDRGPMPHQSARQTAAQRIPFWRSKLLEQAKSEATEAPPISRTKLGRGSRTFVDESHRKHVEMFDHVLKKQTLDTCLHEWRGLARTSVTDYLAGRIAGRVGPDKRLQIEAAITESFDRMYGTRTDSDSDSD
jgi:hypothetical protein